jgi:transglutaminase-like putative cysteine protease
MAASGSIGESARPNALAAIERYFDVSLYLLIVTGFATLVSTGRLDPFAVVGVTLALGLRGWLLLRRRSLLIPDKWTTALTLLYIPIYIADVLFLSASFVTATVHQVLFGMVVKLFSLQRNRDHLYLAILAFLEVLGSAVLTVDSVFLVAFCLFMMLAIATFISMEMKRSAAAATNAAPVSIVPLAWQNGSRRRIAGRLRQLPPVLSATSTALMLAIFAISAAIFFLLPRVSAGYLGAFAPRNELVSGFSNDINQIGAIQQSNTVVMHISLQAGDADLSTLKWRGTALDRFEGQRWTNDRGNTYGARSFDGRFNVEQLVRAAGGESTQVNRRGERHIIRYRVLMEPVGLNVFFLTPRAEMLLGNYRNLVADANGAVFASDANRQITTYDAISDIGQPTPDDLRQAGSSYPPRLTLIYLQFPKLDPRIEALARQITASATTPYDKARELERYLSTNFGYTLQLPTEPVNDPIANFLFVRKQGHCEYFAASMTIMLRKLGIPARVVNGFRGGEYNDVTGSYIVRARDAHAWVEAFFPGYGWISFDPTPAASVQKPAGNWMSRLALYVDAMREFWREWVINYDFAHQRTLTTDTATRARRLVDTSRVWVRLQYWKILQRAYHARDEMIREPRKWGLRTILLLALAAATLLWRPLLALVRRRRVIARPGRAPRAAAGLWYEKMTRRLARRGWRKRPTQSPQEFVRSIADPDVQRGVAKFTGSYERARFGGSSEDAERLPELYDELVGRK